MKPAAPIALLLAVAAAAGCDSPQSEIDAHALSTAAKSLASLSAEARLFARQFGSGGITLDFVLVHQQALAQESLKVATQLARPAPQNLRSVQQRELALNTRLQTALGQVANTAARPAQLAQLEQEFQRIETEAKALGARP
jgi:hypothetical protein